MRPATAYTAFCAFLNLQASSEHTDISLAPSKDIHQLDEEKLRDDMSDKMCIVIEGFSSASGFLGKHELCHYWRYD